MSIIGSNCKTALIKIQNTGFPPASFHRNIIHSLSLVLSVSSELILFLWNESGCSRMPYYQTHMASVSDSLCPREQTHKGYTAAENIHNPVKKKKTSTVKTRAMIQSYISENVIREREKGKRTKSREEEMRLRGTQTASVTAFLSSLDLLYWESLSNKTGKERR